MNRQTRTIVVAVITVAMSLALIAILEMGTWKLTQLLFWVGVCLASELLWVRTLSGDSVHSLAATAKLSTLFVLGPWPALIVILVSTLAGNILVRRTAWYKALYNGSQIMVAGAAAALVYRLFGGPILNDILADSSEAQGVMTILASSRFLTAFLVAGVTYITVNNTLMAWLMSAMTDRSMVVLWRENCLYPEEVQSSTALVLMSPLLLLLYGVMGMVGVMTLLVCLGLVRVANQRYVAVINAQDSLLRGERMGAMGEMAEEVGVALGDYLTELEERAEKLMARARETSEEKILGSVEIIHVNVDHMANLVNGLAAFSSQESKMVLTDVNTIIHRTIEFVKPQNRFDNVEIQFHPAADLPGAEVDSGQMQQVFINLLANAADAMNEASVEEKWIRVESRLDPRSRRIRIEVIDHGPGIPRENLNRVFEPHFTTKETGHGFGLSTVFRIVANHHGHIQAHNTPDAGAIFEIELPAA